jgi:hypothetical protein
MDLTEVVKVVFVLGILGAVWYFFTRYVPMPEPVKQVITIICVVALCIFLLQWAGLTHLNIARR